MGLFGSIGNSFAANVEGLGGYRAGKSQEKGYRKSSEKYQELGRMAPEFAERYDPFGEYRGELAERLYKLVTNPKSMEKDPGYQFQLEEGERAIQRQASASGNRFSGNIFRALMEQGQGLANQQYGNIISRLAYLSGSTPEANIAAAKGYQDAMTTSLTGDAASQIGRYNAEAGGIGALYSGIAIGGAHAGAGLDSYFGTGSGQYTYGGIQNGGASMGGVGGSSSQSMMGGMGSALGNIGAGGGGGAGGFSSGFFGGSAGQSLGAQSMMGGGGGMMGAFSDLQLKQDLRQVDYDETLDLEIFTWEWHDEAPRSLINKSPKRGYIAQEVQKKYPEAVYEEDGYLKINMLKLGEIRNGRNSST